MKKLNDLKLSVVGIVASFVGCIADVLLLYTPNGNYEAADYSFFRDISPIRLLWGQQLGILAIPFIILGLIPVYKALKPAGSQYIMPLAALTLYVVIIGVVYHGLVSMGGLVVHLVPLPQADDALRQARTHFEVWSAVLVAVFLAICIGLFYIIRYKPTCYPPAMAWCNPILIYAFTLLFYILCPLWGGVFLVAGFNLSIFVFLVVSTIILWNKDLH